mgnify:CR=1 FL=1
MPYLDEVNPHWALWQSEKDSGPDVWDRWIYAAQAIAGHSLDGEEDTDGYSLDSAFDAYASGWTPEEYIERCPNA